MNDNFAHVGVNEQHRAARRFSNVYATGSVFDLLSHRRSPPMASTLDDVAWRVMSRKRQGVQSLRPQHLRPRPAVASPHYSPVQSSTILPQSPRRMVSEPARNRLDGRRWVMTSLTLSPLSSMAIILCQVSNISRP